METEMKRLVLGAQKFQLDLRNIQLKYKLSDWELARTKTPIHLHVQIYIQSDKQRAIDYEGLKVWFDANWSPVKKQFEAGRNLSGLGQRRPCLQTLGKMAAAAHTVDGVVERLTPVNVRNKQRQWRADGVLVYLSTS